MSNLSDLLPAGAAAKQLTFTDSGSGISSKAPVILNSDGTVAGVSESTASGSLPLGTRLTVESGASSIGRMQIVADPHNTDRWMISYYNDSGTSGIRIKFVTRSGTTLSDGGATNAGTVSGIDNAYNHAMAFDPVTPNKAVMVFMPGSSAPSAYGTAAVVLTLSTSDKDAVVSFGTPNRFETANFDTFSGAHDRLQAIGTTGNYLAYWANDPSAVKMRVLTVSGTTVTAPGSTTIPYASQARNSTEFIVKVNPYDSSKALLFQVNHSDQYLYINDLALSGSTITATSTGNLVDNSTTWNSDSYGNTNLVYVTSTKFVLGARKASMSSGQGFQRIGNLSGGSFSYGSWETFNPLGGASALEYCYQMALSNSTTTPDKWITIWSTNSSGGSYDKYPFGRIGSYSTDSISFDTNTTMDSYVYNYIYVAKGYDTEGHFLIYGDNGSTTAFVFLGKTGGTSSNLTSTNFVGIADSAISASAAGSVIVQGGTVAGLSSLTAGSKYYVQPDGTFGTSAGDPSVNAGLAISTTSLLLNGDS